MALPSTRYNFKGGKKEVAEAVGEIGKAIFQQVSVSVESAAKMVVPNVADMVAEITEDIKSGSLIQFQEALKKIDTLVNKLGVDINQYSKELGEFLKLRQEKSIKSEETVNQLREKNIMAQVNQMGEVEILNKKQISEQEETLKSYNNEIRTAEKTIESLSKRQQKGRELTEDQQADLIKANNTLIETTEKRNQVLQTLNKQESEDTRTFRQKFGDSIDEYVPDGLRDIGSAFTEGLMAPFTAIKELGMLFGSLLKPLKALPKLLKGFMVGLIGALAAMLPYLLIVGAVVVAIIALKKGFDFLMDNLDTVKEKLGAFADAVMEIPGKIADFFKGIFAKIKNFFIDAINSVIELINKFKPGKDIALIEKEADPNSVDTTTISPATNNVEASEGAEIVPTTPEVSGETEGSSKLDMFKNMLKMLKPNNNELVPTMETNAGGTTIIDNSVKSANQNNTTQSIGMEVRNNDATMNRMSVYSA
jgi:hypothetical protein